MTTTVTLAYEGPPSCRDCQRDGIPTCAHMGFNEEAWTGIPGTSVMLPGLDPAFRHIATTVDISSDRKTVTITVDTDRHPALELARHLSTLPGPKATVRTVHADTGDTLTDGSYDAFLHPGQEVWINGKSFLVVGVDHPNRHPDHGTTEGLDIQVVTVAPQPVLEPVTRVEEI